MQPRHSRIVIASSSGLPRERVESARNDMPHVELVVVADTRDAIDHALPDAHALIGCPRMCFDAEILRLAGPTLRWIHVPGAGCEEFLIPELVASDIILTNGRIIQGPEVADHALALLLALTRNIHLVLRGRLGDGLRPTDAIMPRPLELHAKTAVVVGVGGIGMLIAERLAACGMHVIGVDQECVPMVRALERWVPSHQLRGVLSQADVVVVSAPSTDATRKMFGVEEFRCMQPTAFFINVCRGALVDTEALTAALAQGRLRAAGLDVTDPEPLPDNHPLRAMPNVIITPHIAGPSDQNRERSFMLIQENIARFVAGQPLLNVVNKQLGY